MNMNFFNPFGLVFMIFIMIPNSVFAIRCKDGFDSLWQGKIAKILGIFEQIGRYGCFFFMIFNIPNTYFGFCSDTSFALYLIINGILIFTYCTIWLIYFKKNNLFRAISLSVIPSLVFLYSGIISRSVLLFLYAVIFAPCHITISIKNLLLQKKGD